MKKVYVNETEDPKRGIPVVRWKDTVKEYMHERVADVREVIRQVRRECIDRERWRLFYRGHPLGGCFWRKRGVRGNS